MLEGMRDNLDASVWLLDSPTNGLGTQLGTPGSALEEGNSFHMIDFHIGTIDYCVPSPGIKNSMMRASLFLRSEDPHLDYPTAQV